MRNKAMLGDLFRAAPQQAGFWKYLGSGKETPIAVLWANVRDTPLPGATLRRKQQWVGGIVSVMNKKLAVHDMRIIPGGRRGTYALRPYYVF